VVSDVVAHGMGGGLAAVDVGGDDVLTQDGAGELKIAVGERASGLASVMSWDWIWAGHAVRHRSGGSGRGRWGGRAIRREHFLVGLHF
jgi:hypothetical protein